MSDESIIKELKIAKVEPGDIVVVYVDNGELPPHKAIQMMNDMSSRLKEHLPHLEFLVLPYGHSDIKVVRPVPPITPSFQWDGSDLSPMIPFLQRYWDGKMEDITITKMNPGCIRLRFGKEGYSMTLMVGQDLVWLEKFGKFGTGKPPFRIDDLKAVRGVAGCGLSDAKMFLEESGNNVSKAI